MSCDLQLLGRAKRTHDGYLREVRKLACFYSKSPDQLTQQQVADYLLYLINEKQFAPGSLKVAYSGIKFFYTTTCPRDWDVLNRLLGGWGQYFGYGHPRRAFAQVNHASQVRMYAHLNRPSQRGCRPPESRTIYEHVYHHLGLYMLRGDRKGYVCSPAKRLR